MSIASSADPYLTPTVCWSRFSQNFHHHHYTREVMRNEKEKIAFTYSSIHRHQGVNEEIMSERENHQILNCAHLCLFPIVERRSTSTPISPSSLPPPSSSSSPSSLMPSLQSWPRVTDTGADESLMATKNPPVSTTLVRNDEWKRYHLDCARGIVENEWLARHIRELLPICQFVKHFEISQIGASLKDIPHWRSL